MFGTKEVTGRWRPKYKNPQGFTNLSGGKNFAFTNKE
jgi:hypothetical protein